MDGKQSTSRKYLSSVLVGRSDLAFFRVLLLSVSDGVCGDIMLFYRYIEESNADV